MQLATKTIDRIGSGCGILANTEYIRRHDNVAKNIHQELATQYKLTEQTKTYKYIPQDIRENDTQLITHNASYHNCSESCEHSAFVSTGCLHASLTLFRL